MVRDGWIWRVGAILRGPAGDHLFSCVRRPHVGPQGADCPTATKAKRAMKSTLIWFGSALCGALLLNGCSSGGGNDRGATTTAGATATGTRGTTGQAATGTSTGGGAGTTTNGTTTGGTTGGAPDAGVGATCNPTAYPDAVCAPVGLSCDPASSTCELPTKFTQCLAVVGCAAGLTCTPGIPVGDGGAQTLCVQACTTTPDCSDSLTACTSIPDSGSYCLLNGCGPGSIADGGGNGGGVYLACDSSQTGDGTCYPYDFDAGLQLLCTQAGSVALNASCGADRTNGNNTLCEAGAVCANFGTAANPLSACYLACAATAPSFPDGGPGCESNAVCIRLGERLGACIPRCSVPSDCPSPLTCAIVTGYTGGFCVP